MTIDVALNICREDYAMSSIADRPRGHFPTAAGILFGLGLGGFFDGIVLHQVQQWQHMVSHTHPPVDVPALQLNTFWDGIFHAATYIFVVLGLIVLWRAAHRTHRTACRHR